MRHRMINAYLKHIVTDLAVVAAAAAGNTSIRIKKNHMACKPTNPFSTAFTRWAYT